MSDRADVDGHTKLKQGAVLRAIRGHVMGIPTDYSDTSFATRHNFRPPNWAPEPVSMLPIPRDRVAAQECVGDNTKGLKPTAARPAAKVRFAVEVEAHAEPTAKPTKHDQLAPIKMVSGRAWSLGIYQALRLLGKCLDVAWERAFINPLTFK